KYGIVRIRSSFCQVICFGSEISLFLGAPLFDVSNPVFRRWILYTHAYAIYIKRVEREVGARWGLSVPQILTLYFLNWATDTVTPTALANYLTQEAQSVTSLLQRMEASGLIERRPHPVD